MVVDDVYIELVKRTKGSFPADFPHITLATAHHNLGSDLVGSTHNQRYKSLMLARIEKYLEILKSHIGQQVLFLDADVVILDNFIDDLETRLTYHDMLIQDTPSGKGCAGIMAFNVNEQTMSFWKEVVEHCREIPIVKRQHGYPEVELNEKIDEWQKKGNMDWYSTLPQEYGYICENSKIYHAINGGSSVLEKLTMLNLATQFVKCLKFRDHSEIFAYDRFCQSSYNHVISVGFYDIDDITGKAVPLRFDPPPFTDEDVDINQRQQGRHWVKVWRYSWQESDADDVMVYDYKDKTQYLCKWGKHNEK